MLKDEHADVTISKIRFFESQGLIAPERTPSGYRKFYDRDIERLRWILVQQRDNFLPLKVIKRRLEEAGFDPAAAVEGAEGPLPEPTLFTKPADDSTAPTPTTESAASATAETTDDAAEETVHEAEAVSVVEAVEAVDEADEARPSDAEPVVEVEPVSEAGPVAREVPPPPAVDEGDPLAVSTGSVSLSALDLAESAGVDLGLVTELERLGLIETVAGGDGAAFDHEALVVARAAGVFRARGVEPRHLRMFKVAADRQAGVLEQLVAPKLKKGGESRRLARAELNELVRLGEDIQRSILRRNFGGRLD
jgi:DNA-binding transcriptional MerR regulator